MRRFYFVRLVFYVQSTPKFGVVWFVIQNLEWQASKYFRGRSLTLTFSRCPSDDFIIVRMKLEFGTELRDLSKLDQSFQSHRCNHNDVVPHNRRINELSNLQSTAASFALLLSMIPSVGWRPTTMNAASW